MMFLIYVAIALLGLALTITQGARLPWWGVCASIGFTAVFGYLAWSEFNELAPEQASDSASRREWAGFLSFLGLLSLFDSDSDDSDSSDSESASEDD